MINKYELIYKIDTIIEYLKDNNGDEYKLYNHICPDIGETDSNIVEYAKDVKVLIIELLKDKNIEK